MRAEEALAVEEECRHEDERHARRGEELPKIVVALGVHGTVARDSFDQQQPSLGGMVDNDVRHLAVLVDHDVELGEPLPVVDDELLVGVAHIQDMPARSEARAEVVENPLDEDVLSSR